MSLLFTGSKRSDDDCCWVDDSPTKGRGAGENAAAVEAARIGARRRVFIVTVVLSSFVLVSTAYGIGICDDRWSDGWIRISAAVMSHP